MNLTGRASFDTLYHNFSFEFPSDAHALRYVRDFSGDPIVQNQALHELTHFYFSISPVTRAIRALRNKALFTLLTAVDHAHSKQIDKINKEQLFRAINQWRLADAITQYLLPVYEGTALMAEFDCCLVPAIDESDRMTFMDVQAEQCAAGIKGGHLSKPGLHTALGYPNPKEALLLDATVERLASVAIHARKVDLLNLPLFYESPSECYLVAWLFARDAQFHISRVIGNNVSPIFVIKYLRSYFLEDWELVSNILDIFYERQSDTRPIIQHLQHRLTTFTHKFTRLEYDAYRNGVEEVHQAGQQNFEFLPGVLRDIEVSKCHAVSLDLQRANYSDFAPEHGTGIDKRVYGALIGLQNREGYIAIHQGEYQLEVKSRQLRLSSAGEELMMNTFEGSNVREQTCRVTFHLSCAGEVLQRIARVHAKEGTISAWIVGEANAYAALAGIFGIFEQSEVAESYVKPRLAILSEMYRDDFVTAVNEGSMTGRTIFLEWLGQQQGFYCSLRALSERIGNEIPPRSTFRKLFADSFSPEGLNLLVRHSLVYGVGYNVGELSRGEARERMRQGSNFKPEIDAIYKIRESCKLELQFFYLTEEAPEYALPRYYF